MNKITKYHYWMKTWYKRSAWFQLVMLGLFLIGCLILNTIFTYPTSQSYVTMVAFTIIGLVFAFIGDRRAGFGIVGPLVSGVSVILIMISVITIYNMLIGINILIGVLR